MNPSQRWWPLKWITTNRVSSFRCLLPSRWKVCRCVFQGWNRRYEFQLEHSRAIRIWHLLYFEFWHAETSTWAIEFQHICRTKSSIFKLTYSPPSAQIVIISLQCFSYLFLKGPSCIFPNVWRRWPRGAPWLQDNLWAHPTCPSCSGRTSLNNPRIAHWRSFDFLKDQTTLWVMHVIEIHSWDDFTGD